MNNITAKDLDLIASIAWKLRGNQSSKETRRQILKDISELIRADFIASYIWDNEKKISFDGISYNIDKKLLGEYESYGQVKDIVTPVMSKLKNATIVDDIINRKTLENSQHYNEFLKPSNMHHGINVYFTFKGIDVGDLRIYREKSDPAFSEREIIILNLLKPYFELKLSNEFVHSRVLTEREVEVAQCLPKGLSDKEIANILNISFTTVRTHIKNIMQKLDCKNRTEIAIKFRSND